MYEELVDCGKKYKLMPADLSRISSWGKIGDSFDDIRCGPYRCIYNSY